MEQSFPETLLEFEHWFRTEEACLDYLSAIRWPEGFFCPACGHRQGWRRNARFFRCGSCRKEVSITAGSIFHGSHIPLKLWFRAMWWITNQKSGVNAAGLKNLLGFGSYETAWLCLHKLRKAMVRFNREKLAGQVEVDEALMGGKFHKSTVVIGAECRGDRIGRIRLKKVYGSSAKNLIGFIRENVEEGAEIITDGGVGYEHLSSFGFKHSPFVLTGRGREAAGVMLPRVHRIAALLKRWLLGMHQGRVSDKQLASYLDEFSFRFNRRIFKSRGQLFQRLAEQAMVTAPLTYGKLIR